MQNKVVVRRSVDYGGDRRASSYLVEGSRGYRFAKCSVDDAELLSVDAAKRVLKNVRRKDTHREEATYYIEPLF